MNHLLIFMLTFIVWKMITWSAEPLNFVAGALVSLLIAAIFGREFHFRRDKSFQAGRYVSFIKFLLVFAQQMVKANLVMAYRILTPGPPIKPGIVKIPLHLNSPLGRVILANAITLAPGTFTMDIEDNTLHIHWIYVVTDNPAAAEKIICGKMQGILKEVFE